MTNQIKSIIVNFIIEIKYVMFVCSHCVSDFILQYVFLGILKKFLF